MRSVADRSDDVKSALLRLIAEVRERQHEGVFSLQAEDVEDLLDKFMLWAGSVQFLDPVASFPSVNDCVEEHQAVRDQMYEHLEDLEEAIDDLERIVVGHGIPEITSEVSHEGNAEHSRQGNHSHDEAHMILEVMAQCVRSLFRMNKLVREIGPRDDFKLVTERFDAVVNAESFHSDIAGLEERYPHLRKTQQRWFTRRLGEANEKRRRFIQFRRDKSRERLKKANQADSNRNLDEIEDNISLSSSSATSVPQTSIALPSLESLSPDGDAFECPICFENQQFSQEKAWELHAFRDLKAYVCTVGGTECESALFGDRNAWFQHELLNHRARYKCKLCALSFGCDDESLEKHIIEAHDASKELLSMIIDGSRVTRIQLRAEDCPFCSCAWAQRIWDSGKYAEEDHPNTPTDILVSITRFRDHVAAHQEGFAALAMLPKLRFKLDGPPRALDSSRTETGGRSQEKELTKLKMESSNMAQKTLNRDPRKQSKPSISTGALRQQNDRQKPVAVPRPYIEELSESDKEPISRDSSNGRATNERSWSRSDAETLVGSDHTSTAVVKLRETSVRQLIDNPTPRQEKPVYYGQPARSILVPYQPLSSSPPPLADVMTPPQLYTQIRGQRAGKYEREGAPLLTRTYSFEHQPIPKIVDSYAQYRPIHVPARQVDRFGSASTDFSDTSNGPIRLFIDHGARAFVLPFEYCKEWKNVQDLLAEALRHDDVHRREKAKLGYFDVVNEDGDIILPQFWDKLILPDSDVWILIRPTRVVSSSGWANQAVLETGPAPPQTKNSTLPSKASSATQYSAVSNPVWRDKLPISQNIFDQTLAAQRPAGDYDLPPLPPRRPPPSSNSNNNGSCSSSEETSDAGEGLGHALLETMKSAVSVSRRQMDQIINDSEKGTAAMTEALGEIKRAMKEAQEAARESRVAVQVMQEERKENEARRIVQGKGEAKNRARTKTEDKAAQTETFDAAALRDTDIQGAEIMEATGKRPEVELPAGIEHIQSQQREQTGLETSVKTRMMAIRGKIKAWVRNRSSID